MNVTFDTPSVSRYLRDPKSKEAAAFFEGARAIMAALQLMPTNEYVSALSVRNNQHIIALLVRSEEQQQARRRNDVREILKIYDVDKLGFAAFIFDLPRINQNGQATDPDGTPLEDEMFRLLPGKTHEGWPLYKITHHETGTEISRAEYLALSENAQDDYCYNRYFDLTKYGRPALRICNTDRYMMEELIRNTILINDHPINKRILTEIYYSDTSVGKLYNYRRTVLDTFGELGQSWHTAAIVPMLTAQAKCGYICSMGHYRIAQIQALIKAARANDLLKLDADDLGLLRKIITVCVADDDEGLSQLITDEDIATYRDANEHPLSAAHYDGISNIWWATPYDAETTIQEQKNYFKHILVLQKLAQRLAGMLDRTINQGMLDATTPDQMTALRNLAEVLSAYSSNSSSNPFSNDPHADNE